MDWSSKLNNVMPPLGRRINKNRLLCFRVDTDSLETDADSAKYRRNRRRIIHGSSRG